jgi:asparagine synthase (glutamine-hydrolysing)
MLHLSSYVQHNVVSTDKAIIGFTAYPRYPRHLLTTSNTVILLEGMIYNKKSATIQKELQELASDSEVSGHVNRESLSQFVKESDGEFLIVFYNKQDERVLLMNDSMGRLPFYYCVSGPVLLASRETKFIVPFLESVRFNKPALMEYLLYGFPFAENTLLEGVFQLAPGSILTFDCRSGQFSKTVSSEPALEFTSWTDRSGVAKEMKQRFLQGLSQRVEALGDHDAIVLLSGGLDSRATLGGLLSICPKVRAVTIESSEKSIANRCANVLGIPIATVSCTDEIRRSLPSRSVFLKDGLDSHPSQEMLHHVLDQMRDCYGERAVCYTGNFGGELTRYLYPTSGIDTIGSLTDYVLRAQDNSKYSTERATRMLGFDRGTAHKHVISYLNSFPEKSPYRKYLRFRLEFDRKGGYQGEDRSRLYFWTVTPFTSLGFYRFVTSLDENHKDTRLFRDFLSAIEPRACTIKYYNFGVPLDNTLLLSLLSAAERLMRVPAMKAVARPLWNSFCRLRQPQNSQDDSLLTKTLALLLTTRVARNNFSVAACREILQHERDHKGLMRMYILLVYMNYVDEWHGQLN